MNAKRKLDALFNNERSCAFAGYSLASITALLKEMGNPHHALRSLHIAGTNGKGSTAHFLQQILCAAGFRVGLYTSPHLCSVNERIRIDDELIDDDAFEACAEELFSIFENHPDITPTWFDALTAIAFRYFHAKQVDYAVIEAGLGGRLDSTNVITPYASVITNVDIDHTAVLGGTIEKIAGEKAGIIKKGVPVITAARDGALNVIRNVARDCNARVFVYGEDFYARDRGIDASGYRRFDYAVREIFQVRERNIEKIPLAHHLPEQIINASMAIAVALLLEGETLSDDSIRDGTGKTVVPGRMETLSHEPLVIFDPAHNVAAIEAVSAYLSEKYAGMNKAVVLHCMADKDVDGIIAALQNALTETILYVMQSDERAFVPQDRYRGMMKIFQNEKELVETLRSFGNNMLIFFTGSFRIYGCALRVAKELMRYYGA